MNHIASLFTQLPYLHGIVASALAGTHGRIFTAWNAPHAAILTVGDFLLCGGKPGSAGLTLLRQALKQASSTPILYAPGLWEKAVHQAGHFAASERTGFQLLPSGEKTISPALLTLPQGFTASIMTEDDARKCQQEEWSRDFVSVFASPAAFVRQGLGMLLRDPTGEAVAGASSYAAWPGGIEVQLETRHDQQGRGYGTLIAAQLLQAAWARGLTVSWDAANDISAHIAGKLGFSSTGRYRVWTHVS